MFGISSPAIPACVPLYLPGAFEGHPMRKDFPLLGSFGEAVAWHRRRRTNADNRKPRGHVMTACRFALLQSSSVVGTPPTCGGLRHDCCVRSPTAGIHGRAGCRRPGERRARGRGHDPQHRSSAPGDPRHAAHRRPARRRAGGRRRADHGLHAPWLRETHRGAHLPAGHHTGEPHRLARQLLQRGAVHPRLQSSSWTSRHRLGPSTSARSCSSSARIAHLTLFLGDLGVQLGAVTPVFYAFRDREHVLNQIESATGGRFHPNFDRIGGVKDDLPAGWIAETKQSLSQDHRLLRSDRGSAVRQRDLRGPYSRHRRDPGRRRALLRPERCQHPRLGRRLGPPS